MKAVILSGGPGTRLSDETAVRAKPIVHLGGRPLLWHILELCNRLQVLLEPEAVDLTDGDDTTWGRGPIETLARTGQLSALRHPGLLHPMDTTRDRTHLEELCTSGRAPWQVWA